ncbi:7-cyano-7-deazaguanine synthase [Candidatus Pacearchaeota archaeon]|nr:7-cyano-7-deazaguanine synthase [Candidatus Pacearchaeota archaeon]
MEQKRKKCKAVCLFSGGLDSRLAIKLMQEQGAEVIALFLALPFGSGCCKPDCAFNFSQMQGVKLKIIDCTKGKLFKKYLEIVKHTKYGHGSGMNPCIDCRIFILEEAKKLAKKIKADVIVTGEVLEERPMSQKLRALKLIEKETKLEGKLLRPLSAKLLPETDAEKKGLLDREKFLAIKGRNRKIQLELAKKYNLSYPTPAGGCLLCEKDFARKLQNLFNHNKEISETDIEILKTGRHFRIGNVRVVIGRNEQENKKLQMLATKKDIIMEAKDVMGPVTLVIGELREKELKKAAELTARYSDCEQECEIIFNKKIILAKKATQEEIENLRI